MGTEDSKNNTNTNNPHSDLKLNTSYNSSDKNYIKSSLSEETFSKTKSDKKNIEKINNDKYPVTFEWNGGGNSVYLSGSFCNWNQLFLMKKNSEGKYTLKLDINKGSIQYKFKVDNEWKINPHFPSKLDNGNLNNYMDINKLDIITNNKSEVTTDENTESSNKNELYNMRLNNNKKYGNFYPKYEDMSEARIAPENFWTKINNNNNVRNIAIENINHLNVGLETNNKDEGNKNKNIVSVVSRYRFKCTNFIYYKNG